MKSGDKLTLMKAICERFACQTHISDELRTVSTAIVRLSQRGQRFGRHVIFERWVAAQGGVQDSPFGLYEFSLTNGAAPVTDLKWNMNHAK
jgi:hypothetical protein